MLSIILFSLLFSDISGSHYFSDYEEAKWESIGGEQPGGFEYEHRRYLSAMWASTDVTGVDFDKVGSQAFWRLHDYIKGGNDRRLYMPMTVPVVTTFRNRPCPFCNITYTMSFYIPKAYQNQPPVPTNPSVQLRRMPKTNFFVRRFSGYAKANDWRSETEKLFCFLEASGVTGIDTSAFIAAGYNGPLRFFFRRNEVWLWKKNNSSVNW